MKGSQMEEEEAREENKEEKIWTMRPIDFQVTGSSCCLPVKSSFGTFPIILVLIQDPEQETHVVKIWECYGKDSQVRIFIFYLKCC